MRDDAGAEGRITALKECRHGKMIYLKRDQYIGRSLDLYGEFSAFEGNIFSHWLRPGQCVVEVGSNIGAHTLHLAKLVGPQGTVYAFEPQRLLFQLLCANVSLNEAFNVQTHHAALGRETGTIRVPALDYSAELNFGGVSLTSSKRGEPVPLLKMDSLSVREFHFLKIDVEGMEADVIEGARSSIGKYRPVLYVENDRKENSEALIRLIEELGYDMWWHLPPLFNPGNFAGNPDNAFGRILSVNLLCLPKERAEKVPGLRKVSGPQDWWRAEAVQSHSPSAATPEDVFTQAAELKQQGRLAEALLSYDQAIALKPDYAHAFNNRGNVLQIMGRLEEAVASYRQAIAFKPDYAFAFNNLGGALRLLKRFDEAIAAYDQAVALQPDYAAALTNRAQSKLLLGRMSEGWRDYECRLSEEFRKTLAVPDIPDWAGESLAGRNILIYAEQGLGDIIQFCRYVPMLSERGANVSLLAPANLLRLLSSLHGKCRVLSSLTGYDRFDYRCALMSLPYRLGTRLDNIPAPTPYLSVDARRVEHWRDRIGQHGLRVGICWQGKMTSDPGRSFSLSELYPISQIPGVRLISLQKQSAEEELAHLPPGMSVRAFGEDFDSGPDAFLDTAAMMQNLDLIITCDTAVAHLAGALARPTWLALPYVPDWRWFLDRNDSPWYPTLRLFRQSRRGDWPSVFAEMSAAIRNEAHTGSTAKPSGDSPR